MIVRRFLSWAHTATASQRADGASALARAYLYSDLPEDQRREIEVALTRFLDDPSPIVRHAMAASFASATEAPHHIVLALADDQSDISSLVLGRSPLLTDSELIDCAAIGDAIAQSAVALRPSLSAPVAAAIAEVGACEALISLAINPGADLPEFSMRRMVERHGQDGEMREALLSRPNLPATLRADLVSATAQALSAFVTSCNWMSSERANRVTREARDKANVIIAATAAGETDGPCRLAAHLRACGQLTTSLLLRALLSGTTIFFEAALSELADLAFVRVKGLCADWHSSGFAALYRKAGLPAALLPVFRAALDARDARGPELIEGELSCQTVDRVLAASQALDDGDLGSLLVVLRRLAGEAKRDEARGLATASMPDRNSAATTAHIWPLREPLLLVERAAVPPRAPAEVMIRTRDGGAVPARDFVIDFNALEADVMAA